MFQTQSEHGSSRSVVVSTALISGLLLFSGCEAAPEVLVASSYSRAVPEVPTGKPPIARIEAACLGELCEEMVFTAGSSTDASGYAWTLDGMPYGTEEVVVVDLDLARDADSDGLPDGALFDLSVTVTGHGSDTARVAVLTTPMLPTERFETDSALTGQAGVVLEVYTAVLVVGYESCSQVVTVTNFSGCLTAGSTAGLAVATSGGSGVLGGEDLLYVPPSDLVASLGAAEGAAWDAGLGEKFEGAVTSTSYGGPYPRLALPGATHLTGYYRVHRGEWMTARPSLLLSAEEELLAQSVLDVACDGTTPVVSATSLRVLSE